MQLDWWVINLALLYASNFYEKILKATGLPLLFSDITQSEQGFKIWGHLLDDGNTLMVYDPTNINKYTKINSFDELKQFHGQHPDYEKYRYVLSENVDDAFTDFELMRTYTLSLNNG